MSDIKISQMEPWVGPLTGNEEFPVVTANVQGTNFRVALSQITPSTLGFGTMALQNSDAVNITGGNVAVTTLSGAITIANGGTGLGTTPTAGEILIGNGTGYTLATLTAGSGVSITNGSGAITISATNSGTVTSVGLDGGTTGITVSGANPITSSGTFTLGGVLNIANGGTGATTAAGARTAFGAAKSGANSDITSLSGLTTPLSPAQGGTGAAASLSGYVVANGSSAYTSVLSIPVSDLSGTLPVNQGGTGATTAAAARVNLLNSYSGNAGRVLAVNSGGTDTEWISVAGAGTVTSVDVSGGTTGLTTSGGPISAAGTITLGGTLNVANGGTGATTAADARTNLSAAKSGANTDITSVALTTGTISTSPASANDIVNKQYVDTIATTSIHYHTPVKYEVPNTTGNLNATYNQPGGPGVGVNATLTNAGTKVAFAPDGPTASVGDRILIYNQTNAYENGVYTVTVVGNGSTNWVLTRATDADTYDPISPNALGGGDAFFVTSGNTGAGETYVCNNSGAITFGTTAISFVQVSATQVYSAGTGLTLTGTQFSLTAPVATSLGGTGLTSFTSGGAVYATSTSALTTGTLPITAGGTGQTTASAAFNALSPVTTTGDLIIGNGANSSTRLPIGANGYILTSNGTTASWGPAPSSMVYPGAGIAVSTGSAWGTSFNNTGTPITVAYGGTGAATLTANYLLKGNGTSAVSSSIVYDNGTNVGIGTSSPGSKLDVNGKVTLTGGEDNQLQWTNNSQTWRLNNSTGGLFYLYDVTGDKFPFKVAAGAANDSLIINSSGNVGIGTSSPGVKLDVATSADAEVVARILSPVGASAASTLSLRTGTTNSYVLSKLNDYNGSPAYSLLGGPAVSTAYYGFNNHIWLNQVGTTEYMRINSSGNVGIGTSSPNNKLDVVGSVNIGGALITGTGVSTGECQIELGGNRTGNGVSYIDFHSTASTDYELRVIRFSGANGSAEINNAGTGGMQLNQEGAGPLVFKTNNTERMRIDSSGNVTIAGGVLTVGGSNVAIGLQTTGQQVISSSTALTSSSNAGSNILAVTAGITLTLPTSAASGKAITISNISGGNITLSYTGSAGTDGPTTMATGTSTMLVSDGGSPPYWRQTLPFGAFDGTTLFESGYKILPQNQRTGAYTIALSDIGKHLYVTAGAFAVTVPANSTTAFPVGSAITIICEDAAKTVAPASGVTLVLAGTGAATTGTRTLAIGSVATLIKVQTDRWYISGSGVT